MNPPALTTPVAVDIEPAGLEARARWNPICEVGAPIATTMNTAVTNHSGGIPPGQSTSPARDTVQAAAIPRAIGVRHAGFRPASGPTTKLATRFAPIYTDSIEAAAAEVYPSPSVR